MQHTHYCTENLYGSGGCGFAAELGGSWNLLYGSGGIAAELSASSPYIIDIGNCSETFYIRSFVHYLLSNGHNVAVLNHVGTLRDVPLTGNRLFTYGKMR